MTDPHRTGPYRVTRDKLCALAASTPGAICCRCGLTLSQHKQPTKWTADHTIPGSTTWQPWWNVTERPPVGGDWLAIAEAHCNYSAGATPVAPHVATTRRW